MRGCDWFLALATMNLIFCHSCCCLFMPSGLLPSPTLAEVLFHWFTCFILAIQRATVSARTSPDPLLTYCFGRFLNAFL